MSSRGRRRAHGTCRTPRRRCEAHTGTSAVPCPCRCRSCWSGRRAAASCARRGMTMRARAA
eukprot:5911144-Prymnesium_polylepis.3